MTESNRPEDAERTPEATPEELGNTIDGSGAGDGVTSRGADPGTTDTGTGGPGAGVDPGAGHVGSDAAGEGATSGAGGDGAAQRAEQKKVYQTPEQPDHAVGGSEGTADGQ